MDEFFMYLIKYMVWPNHIAADIIHDCVRYAKYTYQTSAYTVKQFTHYYTRYSHNVCE